MKLILLAIYLGPAILAQNSVPAWCKPRPEFQALKRAPITQEWFEVYVAAPGVFAIYEPRQSEQTISYLITGERSAVLFDTGMGIGDIRKVTSEITKPPITVLNSHTHFDHVGGNWQFADVLAMDTDFTRRNTQGSRDDAQSDIGPSEICGALPAGFDPKTYETRPWKIAGYRHDGDRIDLGGRTLEIIATPGHTPDAICLLDRANGLLFTGDTYYRGTVWLYRPETDLAAYGASVRRLAALAPQVKTVFGAHNVAGDPASVLAKLASAFEAVRAGKVAGTAGTGGKMRYKVGDIGFLLHAQ
jgi:glyoxylase-like metal-dependent hydrolase (beta-lactamase superfamily II)